MSGSGTYVVSCIVRNHGMIIPKNTTPRKQQATRRWLAGDDNASARQPYEM